MNNNVISIKESIKYKKNIKHTYFIDFIDWKNYTLVVDANNEQEVIEIVNQKVQENELSDLIPTKHLFEILKIQQELKENE
jgi:cytidylate kinase